MTITNVDLASREREVFGTGAGEFLAHTDEMLGYHGSFGLLVPPELIDPDVIHTGNPFALVRDVSDAGLVAREVIIKPPEPHDEFDRNAFLLAYDRADDTVTVTKRAARLVLDGGLMRYDGETEVAPEDYTALTILFAAVAQRSGARR